MLASRDYSSLRLPSKRSSPLAERRDFHYHGLPCVWDGSRYVVFSPYALKVARIAPDSLRLDGTVHSLRSQGFFGEPATPPESTTTARVGLILTTGCNLRCKYCYVVPNTQARTMTPDYAIRVIREKITKHTERISLSFFGGEATLNMPALKAAVEYVKTRGLPFQFLINTNGTACDEDLDYLIANQFIFIPSSDGPREINDALRPRVNGSGASGDIERTIQRLVQAGCLFQIRATVSSRNVAVLPAAVDYWADLGARFVHIEPVASSRTSRLSGITAPESEEYISAVKATLDEAERRGVWMISSPYMNLLTPSTYFCTLVAGEKEMFTPDGVISACYRIQSKADDNAEFVVGCYDRLADVFTRNDLIVDRLRHVEVRSCNPCRTCHARYVCAGGCPLRNLEETGRMQGVDPWSCTVKKALVRDAVLRIAENLDHRRLSAVFGESIFETLAAEHYVRS